jgi:4-hydroxybenzoate polyprenyltransferase
MTKWWQFTRERFDPLSHLLMILVFVEAHRVLVAVPSGFVGEPGGMASSLVFILLFAGTTLFFFKLRLYDELKDYELDCIINPGRPLVRGLVTHRDLYRGIVFCILVELAVFSLLGSVAVVAISVPILYSLLMYREFFIRDLIRPHLTTYAVSHTVVSGLLSLALISALSGTPIWELGRSGYLFALNSWCLFNIFEFGRKTYTSSEERPDVASYSKVFGRYGAVALVLAHAAVSAACLLALSHGRRDHLAELLGTASLSLLGMGGAYAILNRAPYGKLYRAFSSVYIVIIYIGYVLERVW